jgi:hypothetical protein
MLNTKSVRGSKGGQIMAIRQRETALALYYTKPNVCKFCNSVIEVPDNTKIQNTKRKQFCNKSCAAKFNNLGKNRHRSIIDNDSDGLHPTKFKRKPNVIPFQAYNKLQTILNKTKGEMFGNRKNWQSARSSIQKSARSIYFTNATHTHCCQKSCTYDLHIDVAHIKPVSEFSNSSYIYEINTKENLIGLCKNHHWEFDNGHIALDDIELPYK